MGGAISIPISQIHKTGVEELYDTSKADLETGDS